MTKPDKPKRQFRDAQDDDWIVLIERVATTPRGYKNLQWDEQRVAITRSELRALAEKYLELCSVCNAPLDDGKLHSIPGNQTELCSHVKGM